MKNIYFNKDFSALIPTLSGRILNSFSFELFSRAHFTANKFQYDTNVNAFNFYLFVRSLLWVVSENDVILKRSSKIFENSFLKNGLLEFQSRALFVSLRPGFDVAVILKLVWKPWVSLDSLEVNFLFQAVLASIDHSLNAGIETKVCSERWLAETIFDFLF